MNRAPIRVDSAHISFAREHYHVIASPADTLAEVFDAISARNGYPGLQGLPAKAKRSILHQAATNRGYGRPWFEKQCQARFKRLVPKIQKRMERNTDRKSEITALWDFYTRIWDENRHGLGGLPAELFYKTAEWRKFRFAFLSCYGRVCCSCGAKGGSGKAFELDHILPRHLYPELAFRPDNCQILCDDCHVGKGATAKVACAAYANGGVL
ncbi:HNH endonuclease [Roseibium algae]|uniref:HNH endonuclease n=1 Tax=Roseibium algae TaxID=3123038 RepID=A0ABU8TJY1_9HYPH